jgi:broad specificity phosphatase PhoE
VKKFICEELLRDDHTGIHVIVSHAIAIKCFTKVWFGYSDDWYDKAENSGNCWISYIENDKDQGFIFKQ